MEIRKWSRFHSEETHCRTFPSAILSFVFQMFSVICQETSSPTSTRWESLSVTKGGGDEEETGRALRLALSSLANWPRLAANHPSGPWNVSTEYGRKSKAALSNMKVLLTAADQPATGLTAVYYLPTLTQFIVP